MLVGIYSSEEIAKLHVQKHVELALKDYQQSADTYAESEGEHLSLILGGITIGEREVISETPQPRSRDVEREG